MSTLCAYPVVVLTKKGGVSKGVNPTLVGVFAENRLPELLVCAQSLSPGCSPYSSFSAV